MRIALFFSYSTSLQDWLNAGFISRELKPFSDLSINNETLRNTGFIFNPTKGLSISPNYFESKLKSYDNQGNLIDSSETDEFTLNFQFKI